MDDRLDDGVGTGCTQAEANANALTAWATQAQSYANTAGTCDCPKKYFVSFQPSNTIVQHCATNGALDHCEVDLRTPSGKTATIPNGAGIQVEGPGAYSVIAVRVYCINGQTSDHWGASPSSFTLSSSQTSIELRLS